MHKETAPAVVALLNVLHRQTREFGPAQSAWEQGGEHGTVAQTRLCAHVRRVQQRLRLAEGLVLCLQNKWGGLQPAAAFRRLSEEMHIVLLIFWTQHKLSRRGRRAP